MTSKLRDEISGIMKTINPRFKMKFAIECAELVLPIFEKEYPEDASPRLAIEAAKKYGKKDATDDEAKLLFKEARINHALAKKIEGTNAGHAVYAAANTAQAAAHFAWGDWTGPAIMSDTIDYIVCNISAVNENNLILAKQRLDKVLEEIAEEELLASGDTNV
jgi:hypothetical protein